MYVHTFTVRPKGTIPFPVDMLRYDGCYPSGETEAGKIAENLRSWGDDPDNRYVELEAVKDRPDWEPTGGRWDSFGWEVVEHLPARPISTGFLQDIVEALEAAERELEYYAENDSETAEALGKVRSVRRLASTT